MHVLVAFVPSQAATHSSILATAICAASVVLKPRLSIATHQSSSTCVAPSLPVSVLALVSQELGGFSLMRA